jgi:hypothetical protein
LDPETRRVLSEFYREEFQRHLEHLQGVGILTEKNEDQVRGACDRFLRDLDRVGWRADLAAVAQTLLERFDTLSRLSELDPRRGH